jgi:hypothetical protein
MKDTNDLNSTTLPQRDQYRAAITRLPITMRPTLEQQLAGWERLFPYEQNRLRAFLDALQAFSLAALEVLTQPMREIESRMGVQSWHFTAGSETMENSSLLARSEYYAEWRSCVQRIYEAVEAEARKIAPTQPQRTRRIVLILPANLPLEAYSAWAHWEGRGRKISLAQGSVPFGEALLSGPQGGLHGLQDAAGVDSSDCWIIDAENKIHASVAPSSTACNLSYATLQEFREHFLAEVNTIPKNLQAADEILAALRPQNWERWWPASLGNDARLRNFVVDLFLSGNGALIFCNSFVEWAASEALRRARPATLVARFGMRAKPKAFTGIAIFENQHRISSLPDVDDPEGSAIDAQLLARYIWLSARRYSEYDSAYLVCISESLHAAWLIAPDNKMPDWKLEDAVSAEQVRAWLNTAL